MKNLIIFFVLLISIPIFSFAKKPLEKRLELILVPIGDTVVSAERLAVKYLTSTNLSKFQHVEEEETFCVGGFTKYKEKVWKNYEEIFVTVYLKKEKGVIRYMEIESEPIEKSGLGSIVLWTIVCGFFTFLLGIYILSEQKMGEKMGG
jgi:hypothetical protein